MKKLFLLFMLMIPPLFAEEMHTGEVVIDLINKGSSWNVTFTATAITERWDENYYLTSDYSSASVQVPKPGYPLNYTAYFDLVNDPIAGLNPILAFGKYKISAIEGGVERAYFYMDWRTSDYGSCPDVYFKYDYASKHFRNYEDTQTIDGTNQTIWDLVSEIEYITSGLELYLNVSNQNSHPYLQWNAYHSGVLGYYIHRTLTCESGTMTSVFFTTNTYYLDNQFEFVNPRFADDQVEYYVTAKISSTEESLCGNLVSINGNSLIAWKSLTNNVIEKEYNFSLKQNYPNPFNPTTKIIYQLADEGFVSLKVYSVDGKEIAVLVNQKQPTGIYSTEFNAVELPSGIYFYKLQTKNYIEIKKMILLR